ncbi:MAG: hypothetical protein ACT4OG_03825 [Alphaproteobacteria bacterium]
MSEHRRDYRIGLFAPHRAVPRPHLLTPAGRFALLCLGAILIGAAVGFAT